MLPYERGSGGRSAEGAIGSDAAYLRLEARLSRPAKAYFGDRCAIYNDGLPKHPFVTLFRQRSSASA